MEPTSPMPCARVTAAIHATTHARWLRGRPGCRTTPRTPTLLARGCLPTCAAGRPVKGTAGGAALAVPRPRFPAMAIEDTMKARAHACDNATSPRRRADVVIAD
eukprot:scaffold12452_cov113-Isochrysis_galbana.AAC.3